LLSKDLDYYFGKPLLFNEKSPPREVPLPSKGINFIYFVFFKLIDLVKYLSNVSPLPEKGLKLSLVLFTLFDLICFVFF
jgi:hypothetical protein